jgi:preprotein translocase subunit SecF
MQLIRNTNIDFIGKKKISFVISAIVALVGIVGVVQIARNQANMGIDFSGGTSVQLSFSRPVSMEQARSALTRHNVREANLQEIKESNRLLIKVGKTALATGNAVETITDVFRKELPGNPFVVESTTEIGPSIGDKLKSDTLTAVALSMLGIVVYIAWRFDFKFGIGAVVATLHDVLAMSAVFYVLGKEINLLFVTAVLTIAGYSLTDTVVVFDRIRENIHKTGKESLEAVFNLSINEVLSRTVVTSLTTFLAATSLLIFGGEVIHDFALALVVGIVVATYSSIFIASPIVAELEVRSERAREHSSSTSQVPRGESENCSG